jgi:hypothetical protein
MTASERRQMWVDYVKASPEGYIPNALSAVLRAEGPEMLSAVLKALGWSLSVDLIKRHSEDR